jgi:hypothetical protein
MNNIFFWKKWNTLYKRFYLFLVSLFFLSFIFLIIAELVRESFVIDWQVVPEIDSIRSSFNSFSQSLINYTLDTENFLIRERYIAEPVKVFPLISYGYLLLVVISVIIILTVITYLDLPLFIIGIAVFLVFLATAQTEKLMIFGKADHRFLIGLIILYVGLGYYFHSFNKNIAFFKRAGLFALLTLFAGLIIAFTAKVEDPFLYLSNYGIVVPLFISLLFFIIISFDIIKAFLYITTDSKNTTGKNSLLSFSAITLLYLANVLLVYMKKALIIDWDIVYFNPYYIYIIAATLGIWSYKKRSVLFKEILPFSPAGAYYYLALGIITTSTIAFALITGNDPLAESLEYFIIYTQLCFGVVFYLYILINFLDAFNKTSVYQIIYQPRRAPFFIVRSVGFVALIALFLFASKFPYYLGLSGYFNSAGDIYSYQHDYETAKDYYGKGVQYEFQNHRSNYSLAALAQAEGDYKTAIEYYERANIKRPFEYAYVNLANVYRQEDGMFFSALFKLRDGLSHFPQSDKLANNLGLLYNKTALKDSALYYLNMAEELSAQKEVPVNNKMAIYLKEGLFDIADSISKIEKHHHHLPFINNTIANENIFHRKYTKAFDTSYFKDSLLNNITFSYLYNHGINRYTEADSVVLATIERLLGVEANEVYTEDLNLAKGLKIWHGYDKIKGKEILDQLSGREYVNNENITKTTGLLLLKDKAHASAAPYFKILHPRGDQDAYLKYCISLLHENQTDEALFGLKNLKESQDMAISSTSANLIQIFNADKKGALMLEEKLRTQWLYFRSHDFAEQDVLDIYNSLNEPKLRTAGAAATMNYFLERKNPESALQVYGNLKNPVNPEEELNLQYLKTLAATKNWNELDKQTENISLSAQHSDYKIYFKALAADGRKQNALAQTHFEKAVLRLPFDSDVVIDAAAFFNRQSDNLRAYEILLRSVRHMPETIPVLKAYALQALRMNMDTYAENTLDQIRMLSTDKDFREFKNKFEEVRRQQEEMSYEDIY